MTLASTTDTLVQDNQLQISGECVTILNHNFVDLTDERMDQLETSPSQLTEGDLLFSLEENQSMSPASIAEGF